MKVTQRIIRVVIIEDYRLIRLGIRCDFENSPDVEVLADFETAEQGLDFIRHTRPDVVVMDLGLPGMNGIEAIRKVKAIDSTIKVLVLTSHDTEEEVVSAFGAAANAYCLKTIDSGRLVEVLKMVADGAAWLDPDIARIALNVFSQAEQTHRSTNKNAVPLTGRETEILKLMVEGKSNTEIAHQVHLSVHTVKSYISSIFQKLEVNDRVQASVKAIQSGFIR